MPMFESCVAITTSQQPRMRGVAREAAAGVDADQRHQTAQAAEEMERHAVEARHAGGVGVARTSAAAFGEEDDGKAQALGELEHAILLAVVLEALRARQHGVVVRHARRTRAFCSSNRSPLTGPTPATRPSAGRALDQILHGAPLPLRRDLQRAVLDEGARVAEIVDVLARRALPRLAPPRHRLGARRVEGHRVPLLHLGEIGAHAVGVDLRRRFRVRLRSTSRGSMKTSGCPSGTVSPSATASRRTTPLAAACDDVLHLHRVHHQERLPLPDRIALADRDADDRALHGGVYGDGVLEAGGIVGASALT